MVAIMVVIVNSNLDIMHAVHVIPEVLLSCDIDSAQVAKRSCSRNILLGFTSISGFGNDFVQPRFLSAIIVPPQMPLHVRWAWKSSVTIVTLVMYLHV